MRQRSSWLVGLALAWVVAATPVSAQVTGAVVTETTDVVLHVDREDPLADDGNDGSVDAPLATIGEAVQRAMANRAATLGTSVRVHAGIYRERVALHPDAIDPLAPTIIIEGVGSGESIIAGSDVWANWQPIAGGLWQRPWHERYGLAPVPEGWDQVKDLLEDQPVVRRREVVFVDGQLLRQVLTRAELESEPGTFLVEEGPGRSVRSGGPGTITLHPVPTVDMSATIVEVAARPETLVIDRMANLVVRNLTLRQANSELHTPSVVVTSSDNVLLDGCRIEWNNWNGLSIFRSDAVTVRDVRASWNGAGGVTAWRVRNLLVTNSEASHNNWRGAWGGFYGWAVGQKFLSIHGARFVDYRATGNEATGLWLDTDIEDVTIQDAEITDNRRGMFLEAMQGPVILRDSIVRNNRGTGILATNSANVTLRGNRIEGNQDHQLVAPWTVDQHALRVERNFETAQFMHLRMENWTIAENVIGGQDDATLLGAGLWTPFMNSLVSTRNHWYQATAGDRFHLYPTRRAVPEARTFADWQRISGQDRDSTFSSTPLPALCEVTLVTDAVRYDSAGGVGRLTVTTSPSDCAWTAASSVPWMTIVGGSDGTGAALVTYDVAPNLDSEPRVGSLMVGGRQITVHQDGTLDAGDVCDVAVPSLKVTLDASGGRRVLATTSMTAADCSALATSGSDWLRISTTSSSGRSGTLEFLADPNPSSSARDGSLTVAGRVVTVVQHGSRTGGPPIDVNGDGIADILRLDPLGGWTIDAFDGGAAPGLSGNWHAGWSVMMADFDVDGYTDLLLYNLETGRWRRGLNERDGHFSWRGGVWRPGLSVCLLDLNGDGRPDVFLYDRDTGEWAQALMAPDGSQEFSYHLGRWSPGWSLVPGHFVPDGRAHLLLFDARTGMWRLAISDGTGDFSYRGGQTSPDWDLYPGDFDGDGLTDVFVYRPRVGDWRLALTRGEGFHVASGRLAPGWVVRTGDLDGDHDADLLLYAQESGEWRRCLADASGPSTCDSGRWAPDNRVWVTDLNGDRLGDAVLYDPERGTYRVAVNTASGAFLDVAQGNWGAHVAVVATQAR